MIDIVENDWRPRSTSPKGEPQLGRRGLYAALGGDKDGPAKSMALLWVLNLADGRHTLLDIAERAQLPFAVVAEAARLLRDSGLLVEDRAAGRPQALEGLPIRRRGMTVELDRRAARWSGRLTVAHGAATLAAERSRGAATLLKPLHP